MKFSFKILAILVAIVFAFFNYSVSLGIIIATVALEIIKLSRKHMENRVMNAKEVSSKMIFSHFFVVILIMVVTLGISFLFQDLFNPFGVALTFIADRVYSFIAKSFIDDEGVTDAKSH